MIRFLLICGHVLVLSFSALASDQTNRPPVAAPAEPDSLDQPRYVISLPRVLVSPEKTLDTLDITIQWRHAALGAFDLRIGHEGPLVTIEDILPGNLQDSCGWEFFAARRIPNTGGGAPSLWKLVGLARTWQSDSSDTMCAERRDPISLARLVVSYSSDSYGADTLIPLFFYWIDCRDNVLSDERGVNMMISRQVISYTNESPAVGDEDVFPTRGGTPHQCVKLDMVNRPQRTVDFRNGVFRIPPALADSLGLEIIGPIDSTSQR